MQRLWLLVNFDPLHLARKQTDQHVGGKTRHAETRQARAPLLIRVSIHFKPGTAPYSLRAQQKTGDGRGGVGGRTVCPVRLITFMIRGSYSADAERSIQEAAHPHVV